MKRYPNLMSPRRGGYWPECLGVVLICVIMAAGSIAVAMLLATGAHAATVTRARAYTSHHKPSCQQVTFGWRTPTGHEADAPVTVCGLPIRQPYLCELSGPLHPGDVAVCSPPGELAGTAGPAR